MAVETGMNNFRTEGSADVNTQQCPAGQVMYRGMCVSTANLEAMRTAGSSAYGAGGTLPETPTTQTQTTETPTTTAPNQLSQIFGDIRGGFQQATTTNIEAARQSNALQQEQLNRQLEQQRQDYLRNRQDLQRETFLRGRNVLSNLANRGLATSGLLQLGDVQRTIATGQQMSGLSQAFENARAGLTAQQRAAQTGLQQFEAGQQSQLAQQLAGLKLQEQQAGVTEAERSVAYAESLASLLQDPNIPQNIKDTLAPLYQQLITTPQAAGGTTGSLAEDLRTSPTFTPSDLISRVTSIEGVNLTTEENNALNTFITGSENLAAGSPLIAALSNLPEGQEITPLVTTKAGYAGLNDDYTVDLNGQQFVLDGKEMAALIMSGRIKVSPAIAVSILQGRDGRITRVSGERNKAFTKPYLQWLQQQGYITSRTSGERGEFVDYDITETVQNQIR